jgi:hypothetical protein
MSLMREIHIDHRTRLVDHDDVDKVTIEQLDDEYCWVTIVELDDVKAIRDFLKPIAKRRRSHKD